LEFTRYESMTNHTEEEYIEKILDHGLSSGVWKVTEKVHGANFSFYVNSNSIKIAKRSGFTTGNFFNSQIIVDRHENDINNIYKKLVEQGLKANTDVIIFGEVFGGIYGDMIVEPGIEAVQNGIEYTNDICFYLFDIKIGGVYQSDAEIDDLISGTNLFKAPTLFKGTFEECIKYNNKFDSLIPEFLGLKKMSDNICEGIIVEPIVPIYFESGKRVKIKSKNDKWSEVEDKKPTEDKTLDENTQNELSEFIRYITENRLRNVLSKEEEIDFLKISTLLFKDGMEDYFKDRKSDFLLLDGKERGKIMNIVKKKCSSIIRNNIKKIEEHSF